MVYKKMKTSPKLILQMILILGLIVYSFQKSTLTAEDILNQFYDTNINTHFFDIAQLNTV